MNIQEQILKKYPNVKVYTATTGYFVGYESNDGIVNLLADLFLPNQPTKEKAWECALLSIKTTQNFNRTHPLRIDMYSELEKQKRVSNRRIKTKINKEKFNKPDIY